MSLCRVCYNICLKKKNIVEAEKIIFLQNKNCCKNTLRIKNILTSICNSWSVFREVGIKFDLSETRLHTVNFSKTNSRRYSMKGKPERNFCNVFLHCTLEWLRPYMFLQDLNWWRYRASGYRKPCFLKVPVLQWNNHLTQFNLEK